MKKFERVEPTYEGMVLEARLDVMAELANAHSEAIEACLERLDIHCAYRDAHEARLDAIEEWLGLKVYAVEPGGGVDE